MVKTYQIFIWQLLNLIAWIISIGIGLSISPTTMNVAIATLPYIFLESLLIYTLFATWDENYAGVGPNCDVEQQP